MRTLLWALVALSLVALIGVEVVRRGYASRAEPMQRAQVDSAASSLFGDAEPTLVGSPQLMVVDDPKAFLPGKGAGGARLLNEDYLRRNGVYPLQMKTVDYVASLVRFGAIAAALLSALGLFLIGRRARASQRGPQTLH